MLGNERNLNNSNFNKKQERKCHKDPDHDCLNITIHIHNTFNIGKKEYHIEQRAEGGGQINKDVGTNANQGGQNALNRSQTKNEKSQFADGNGRSGIAGDHNDEAGGQQGIKVKESVVTDSDIHSSSNHSESQEDVTEDDD